MAVKRDYGSFSRAATKLLAPLVAQFAFTAERSACFSRPRDGWNDALFLQQSGYGSGDFCVSVGIHVPRLSDYWQIPDPFGLIIGWRLSDLATEHGGDCWYHAKNKEQFNTSLKRVAHNLERALPWFEQFKSLYDVTEGFRSRSGNSKRSTEYPPDAYETFAMNYAFLLALSGDATSAREWLVVAHARATMPRYWDSANRMFHIEPKPGTKLFRQTKETRKRISIIEAAMKRLETVQK